MKQRDERTGENACPISWEFFFDQGSIGSGPLESPKSAAVSWRFHQIAGICSFFFILGASNAGKHHPKNAGEIIKLEDEAG